MYEGEQTITGEVVELSMKSLVGLIPSQTMKVKRVISAQEVVVLIDCGASHNFVLAEQVQKLGLLRMDTTGYGVIIGTGMVVQGVEVCKGMLLSLLNIDIVGDFLPLDLGSSHVILGMKWL